MTEELLVQEKDFKDLNEGLKRLILPLLQFATSTDYCTFIEFLIPEGRIDFVFDPQKLIKMGFKSGDVTINRRVVNYPFLSPIEQVIESRTITLKW